jgi:uncharacterized membrane protein YcjF (UPF0283 family)
LKRDYLYWTIFFVLFAILFKVLEWVWDNIQALDELSIMASRLIIIIIVFIISIISTEKINGLIKRK